MLHIPLSAIISQGNMIMEGLCFLGGLILSPFLWSWWVRKRRAEMQKEKTLWYWRDWYLWICLYVDVMKSWGWEPWVAREPCS